MGPETVYLADGFENAGRVRDGREIRPGGSTVLARLGEDWRELEVRLAVDDSTAPGRITCSDAKGELFGFSLAGLTRGKDTRFLLRRGEDGFAAYGAAGEDRGSSASLRPLGRSGERRPEGSVELVLEVPKGATRSTVIERILITRSTTGTADEE
jgi:hypothetical protein